MASRQATNQPNALPATRERILDAAAEILSTRGYSGTRLADIARLARVQAPALYYYFDSREALIAEVMAVGQRRLREHVEASLAALPSGTDPMDRIAAAVRAHLEVELRLSDFATAVTRNIGQLPEEIREPLRAAGAEYIALWRRLLEVAHAAGAIRPGLDLRAARMLVMGALNWTPEWWDPRQGALDGVIETAQSLVRHGLGPACRNFELSLEYSRSAWSQGEDGQSMPEAYIVDAVRTPVGRRNGGFAATHWSGSRGWQSRYGTSLEKMAALKTGTPGGRYGLQTMCEGGGQANVTILERLG